MTPAFSLVRIFFIFCWIVYTQSVQSPTQTVYGWGNGENGVLGDGNIDHHIIKVPTTIQALKNMAVMSVAAGEHHSLILTVDGKVYSFGRGDFGVLGDRSFLRHNVSQPYHISSIGRVKSIAVGTEHSLAITESGQLYSWGRGQYGRLGNGYGFDHSMTVPKPVHSLIDIEITQISAGNEHSIVLTAEGKVYTMGSGKNGQLGDVKSQVIRSEPYLVESLQDQVVVAIAAGHSHSLVLTDKGIVYSFGNGKSGVLGDQDVSDHVRATPHPITTLPANTKIMAIAAWGHSMLLTEEGIVYTFGENSDGRLGKSPESLPSTGNPQQVSELRSIIAIAAGATHSLACDKKGRLYAFGSNDNGVLGINKKSEFQSVPVHITTFPYASNDSSRISISAGSKHSLVAFELGSLRVPQNESCPLHFPIRCHISGLCVVSHLYCVEEYIVRSCNFTGQPYHCYKNDSSSHSVLGTQPVVCVKSPNHCFANATADTTLQKCSMSCDIKDNISTTFLCWNGECRQNRSQCQTVPACPPSLPKRCMEGCVPETTNCSTPIPVCSENDTILCQGTGACVANQSMCEPYDGCPLELPIMCPNGTCTNNYKDCYCNGSNLLQCYDGSCVVKASDCDIAPFQAKPVEIQYSFSLESDSESSSFIIYSAPNGKWDIVQELSTVTISKVTNTEKNVGTFQELSIRAVSDSQIREIVNNTYGFNVTEEKMAKLVSSAFTLQLSHTSIHLSLEIAFHINIPKQKNSSYVVCLAKIVNKKIVCEDASPQIVEHDGDMTVVGKTVATGIQNTYVVVVSEKEHLDEEFEETKRAVSQRSSRIIVTIIIGCVVFISVMSMLIIKLRRRYSLLKNEHRYHSLNDIVKNLFQEEIPMDVIKSP